MKRILQAILLAMFVFLPAAGAEDTLIHVHLFRGAWPADGPGLKSTQVWTSSSEPKLGALASKLGSPRDELTASVIEMIVDTQGLESLDEYFGYAEKWTGRPGVYARDIEHQDYRFKFGYVPRRLASGDLELGVSLFKSPDDKKGSGRGGRMDRLLETKLRLGYGDPVLVGIPYGAEAFFLLIFIERSSTAGGPEQEAEKKPGRKQPAPIVPPKEAVTLVPAYPEELREQGVEGEVGLQVVVDEKGAVAEVKVTRSLHPYLDFAAVQAVRQWTFEPATRDGRAVSASMGINMIFDPEKYRRFEERTEAAAETGIGETAEDRAGLGRILDGVAAYCARLEGAALEFICEERINEIHYNFASEPRWTGLIVGSRRTGQILSRTWFPQWDPKKTIRNEFVCDYLFVRRDDRIEERRIVLKDRGRKMADRSRLLEDERFTALNPVLAAVELLGRDRQPLFNYRLIGREDVQGRMAAILEAMPRSGNSRGIEYAKIWIDQENYQVLKSEVQGVPLEGYDDVLRDAVQFRVRPYLLTTHAYELEKNGIRFPGRSTIRVEYPKRGDFTRDRTLKLKIDMTYGRYQFFSVEVVKQPLHWNKQVVAAKAHGAYFQA